MNPKLSIISWNIAKKEDAWRELAAGGADVALVQEAVPPPPGIAAQTFPHAKTAWRTSGGKREFCAAIACLNSRVTLRQLRRAQLPRAEDHHFPVSRPGSLAVAEVKCADGERITVISMYAVWERARGGNYLYADGSAHRLISDLTWLLDCQRGHKIIAAGDLNIYHGYGENGSPHWHARFNSVFDRMNALGLPFVGPQHPNGWQPETPPEFVPPDSKNVPTFRTRMGDHTSAKRQLDFVFASKELHDRLTVTALNSAEQWGPSDHSRVQVELR
jgi:prepilin-type processing-associated H-X9-DG protein